MEGCHCDSLLLMCIRHVVLDSMWARERSTVQGNLNKCKRYVKIQFRFEIETSALTQLGPWPFEDVWGMRYACAIVMRSLEGGKNAKTLQFGTIRKLRIFASKYCHAGVSGSGPTFMSDDGLSARISNSPTNSLWFTQCMNGIHRRMGDIWLPDKATSRYII